MWKCFHSNPHYTTIDFVRYYHVNKSSFSLLKNEEEADILMTAPLNTIFCLFSSSYVSFIRDFQEKLKSKPSDNPSVKSHQGRTDMRRKWKRIKELYQFIFNAFFLYFDSSLIKKTFLWWMVLKNTWIGNINIKITFYTTTKTWRLLLNYWAASKNL